MSSQKKRTFDQKFIVTKVPLLGYERARFVTIMPYSYKRSLYIHVREVP